MTAEIWRVLILQQIIEGIGILLLITLGWFGYIFICKKFITKMINHKYGDFILGGWTIGIIAGIIISFVTIINITDGIGKIINPQYYAAKDIIDTIREEPVKQVNK